MRMLNVGCGRVFHPEWINLDFTPLDSSVQRCDLRRGLPFGDGSIDVVYHSHVLEHLGQESGRRFLNDCFRILRPGGIIRIAVPDLESLAREYLDVLASPLEVDSVLHAWLRLELFDQFTRTRPGGDSIEFLRKLSAGDLAKVRRRMGTEMDGILIGLSTGRSGVLGRARAAGMRRIVSIARLAVAGAFVRIIAGQSAAAAFREGVFRASGEVHRMAFDRISLGALLTSIGFADVNQMQADASRIPEFSCYALETIDGEVRKPDSLFMEAVRP